jgi:hypothetical protein
MKLTIEINDDAFAHAINKEVGKSIAEMAEASIVDRVEEIVNKKVERKIDELMPLVFEGAQEAMQKAFVKSITMPKKKR